MKKQRCPKCSAPRRSGSHYECDSRQLTEMGGTKPQHTQSALCRERCKVAKLKKQVEKLKERAESAEWAVKELQKTVNTLRNPNF